jgi:hypothetical protein
METTKNIEQAFKPIMVDTPTAKRLFLFLIVA